MDENKKLSDLMWSSTFVTSASPSAFDQKPMTFSDLLAVMAEFDAKPMPVALLLQSAFKTAIDKLPKGAAPSALSMFLAMPVHYFETTGQLLAELIRYRARVVKVMLADGQDIEAKANIVADLVMRGRWPKRECEEVSDAL